MKQNSLNLKPYRLMSNLKNTIWPLKAYMITFALRKTEQFSKTTNFHSIIKRALRSCDPDTINNETTPLKSNNLQQH